MKLTCPKCGCVNESLPLVEGLYRCTGCAEWFNPSIRAIAENPQAESRASFAADAPAREPARDLSESKKLRSLANGLTGLSGFFAVLGLVAGLVGLSGSLSGSGGLVGYICAGGLIGVALWFFLIAQIVHVRALLAKK